MFKYNGTMFPSYESAYRAAVRAIFGRVFATVRRGATVTLIEAKTDRILAVIESA